MGVINYFAVCVKIPTLPIHPRAAHPTRRTRTHFWCRLQWCHFSSFNRSQRLLITAMPLWMCALFTCVTQFTICSLGGRWKKKTRLKINKLCSNATATTTMPLYICDSGEALLKLQLGATFWPHNYPLIIWIQMLKGPVCTICLDLWFLDWQNFNMLPIYKLIKWYTFPVLRTVSYIHKNINRAIRVLLLLAAILHCHL